MATAQNLQNTPHHWACGLYSKHRSGEIEFRIIGVILIIWKKAPDKLALMFLLSVAHKCESAHSRELFYIYHVLPMSNLYHLFVSIFDVLDFTVHRPTDCPIFLGYLPTIVSNANTSSANKQLKPNAPYWWERDGGKSNPRVHKINSSQILDIQLLILNMLGQN